MVDAPPKPAAEMAQLSYMVGTWNCAGKTFATPFGPEHATEGVAKAQMALDGFRLVIHYDEAKTAASPMPFHVLQVVGYDSAQKAFDSTCFDNFGGSCTQTTQGWKGNVLVFEGTGLMGGQKMGARDTFTKVSATEMTTRPVGTGTPAPSPTSRLRLVQALRRDSRFHDVP